MKVRRKKEEGGRSIKKKRCGGRKMIKFPNSSVLALRVCIIIKYELRSSTEN